jgi:hypothetical protein
MPLYTALLRREDFDTIIGHANLYNPGDDLVAPPYPVAWTVSTRVDADQRLQFAVGKQRRRFQEDPTARFITVVDTAAPDQIDGGDIVSIAR